MFKENKKMKATKKIVGAACALVAAVALSAGSTFAWFVSNKSVTANGLEIGVVTNNSYLVISDELATLRTLNRTSIDLAPTEDNPKQELNPSAHKEVVESAEDGKILASDLTTVGNWYTGKGTTPTNGALNGDPTPLTTFDKYVVVEDIFVSVATGSDKVSNVMMKMDLAEGSWDTEKGNSAISVVVLYQNITNAGEISTWSYKEATDSNNHAISSETHGYLDLGEVTELNYLQIKVMVYFDGNNPDVTGVNAASLTGVKLNFTFADKTSLTLS